MKRAVNGTDRHILFIDHEPETGEWLIGSDADYWWAFYDDDTRTNLAINAKMYEIT